MPKQNKFSKRSVTVIATEFGGIEPIRGATIAVDGKTWLADADGNPYEEGQLELRLHPGLYAISVTYNGVTAERAVTVRTNGSPQTHKIAVAIPDNPINGEPAFDYTVYVYNLANGNPVEGATVVLEPRQSGLDDPSPTQPTDINGKAVLSVNNSGRYDVEVTHPDYYPETHQRRNVSSGGGDTFYLQHE